METFLGRPNLCVARAFTPHQVAFRAFEFAFRASGSPDKPSFRPAPGSDLLRKILWASSLLRGRRSRPTTENSSVQEVFSGARTFASGYGSTKEARLFFADCVECERPSHAAKRFVAPTRPERARVAGGKNLPGFVFRCAAYFRERFWCERVTGALDCRKRDPARKG